MPELPEVETVKNSLKDLIIGEEIKDVKVYYDKILKNISKDDFENSLKGEHFLDIQRKGKFLIFILDHYIMVSHLRMEGKYLLHKDEPINKHEHIIYTFEDGKTLRYADTRKFGVVYLFKETNVEKVKEMYPLNTLGIEPISNLLTAQYLQSKMGKSNKPIKTLLLDQTIISGLGNIYSDEVCFMCKLNPHEIGKNLSTIDFENICVNSKIVLEKAIKLGGTTIRSFMSSHEITGKFQNELLVHTKTNCPICQSKIKKVYIGGRGTYYCPNCQKVKKMLIGITGGIACGKSEVMKYLNDNKYKTFNCDEYSHSLLLESKVKNEIVKTFGEEVLEGNVINRHKLADLIFNNNANKQKLEAIIHPLVINKIKELNGLVFVEVPLLFEANMAKIFQKIICISSSRNVEIDRLMKRNNLSLTETEKRINAQIDLLEKEKRSDYVINNNTDIVSLYKQIEDFLKTI